MIFYYYSYNLAFFIVTMKWWNDLWLNEGFATFIEYKGVQEFQPDWDIVSIIY